MIPLRAITLGVLAGGRGSRMGGVDKAWVVHHGLTLLESCLARFPDGFVERLVSARTVDARHAGLGLRAVLDGRPGFLGPVAGLESLALACRGEWLFTVPVDLLDIPPGTLEALREAASPANNGAFVQAGDGPQPLLALWRTAALAAAARAALDAGERAARELVARLGLVPVDIAPSRLRNLNTPEALQAPTR